MKKSTTIIALLIFVSVGLTGGAWAAKQTTIKDQDGGKSVITTDEEGTNIEHYDREGNSTSGLSNRDTDHNKAIEEQMRYREGANRSKTKTVSANNDVTTRGTKTDSNDDNKMK